MITIFNFLYWACELYILILIGRVIFDFAQIFARDWQPRGAVLVAANWIYRLTDPPLRLIGRYIQPVRFGAVAIDIGFIVLYFSIKFLMFLITRIAVLLI
ncbi:YggT family protein [Arcanobacterium bovis]|uniref:YggT family protein n=1 Tax=Arcanobacterium bovis TaxID=2529275 RepID=A0A4Q9V1P4_9ACTO|nr:YggT family protein [Arcanobacterium bovis]TBW23034.1 YggT family protein [Arcanobacterium bovis]